MKARKDGLYSKFRIIVCPVMKQLEWGKERVDSKGQLAVWSQFAFSVRPL